MNPHAWGVTTRHGNTVYVHVLDWEDPLLSLPPLPGRVVSARRLVGGALVSVTQTGAGVTLALPPRRPGEVDLEVALTLEPRP